MVLANPTHSATAPPLQNVNYVVSSPNLRLLSCHPATTLCQFPPTLPSVALFLGVYVRVCVGGPVLLRQAAGHFQATFEAGLAPPTR
jgi:hypothetical protein